MACSTCGKTVAKQFQVELPNGTTMIVNSEAQARAEITKAGGGRYRPIKK